MALRRPRSAASYQETLRLLAEEIDHMTRMVRGLLVLARLDRDHYTFTDTTIDLATLVQETATVFQESAVAKNLAFSVQATGPAWIAGQPDLLREVITNVLDNAIKYTPDGSVTVLLETEDGQAVLAVTDTGTRHPCRGASARDGPVLSGSGHARLRYRRARTRPLARSTHHGPAQRPPPDPLYAGRRHNGQGAVSAHGCCRSSSTISVRAFPTRW